MRGTRDNRKSQDLLTFDDPPREEPNEALLEDVKLQLLALHRTLDLLIIITGAPIIAMCAVAEIRIANAILDRPLKLWLEAVILMSFEVSYVALLAFMKFADKRAWKKFNVMQKVRMAGGTVVLAAVLGAAIMLAVVH